MNVVGISAATAILLSLLVAAWMSQAIKRLTRYAHGVGEGKRVPMPPWDRSEIGEMGKACEGMRGSLKGKNYVEHYVQTLTLPRAQKIGMLFLPPVGRPQVRTRVSSEQAVAQKKIIDHLQFPQHLEVYLCYSWFGQGPHLYPGRCP